EYIRFEQNLATNIKSTVYAPGSPAFQRLISRVIATGVHDVEDADRDPARSSEDLARKWVTNIGARAEGSEIKNVCRCFEGSALLRVRATVAHDNYERLIDVPCSPAEHRAIDGQRGLATLNGTIDWLSYAPSNVAGRLGHILSAGQSRSRANRHRWPAS